MSDNHLTEVYRSITITKEELIKATQDEESLDKFIDELKRLIVNTY